MTYYVEEIATSPFSLALEIYFYSRYNLSQGWPVLDQAAAHTFLSVWDLGSVLGFSYVK